MLQKNMVEPKIFINHQFSASNGLFQQRNLEDAPIQLLGNYFGGKETFQNLFSMFQNI